MSLQNFTEIDPVVAEPQKKRKDFWGYLYCKSFGQKSKKKFGIFKAEHDVLQFEISVMCLVSINRFVSASCSCSLRNACDIRKLGVLY